MERSDAVAAPAVAEEEEAEARLGLARARAGIVLDPEATAAVRAQIVRSVAQAGALRAVPLGNADEPEIVFVPFRGADPASR